MTYPAPQRKLRSAGSRVSRTDHPTHFCHAKCLRRGTVVASGALLPRAVHLVLPTSPECGRGGTGRRATLRSLWANARGSSSLLDRTNFSLVIGVFLASCGEVRRRAFGVQPFPTPKNSGVLTAMQLAALLTNFMRSCEGKLSRRRIAQAARRFRPCQFPPWTVFQAFHPVGFALACRLTCGVARLC